MPGKAILAIVLAAPLLASAQATFPTDFPTNAVALSPDALKAPLIG